jgi:ABC-2 type transport system ATP-binding protein
MPLAIDVHDLSKRFGALQAVNHVSIQIEQGHITGFLGPNGSGKTTTLRMLCGLLTPDSGSGQVLGLDFPREAEAIKRQTGYMTQRFSLYEDLTIEENLAFIARVYSLDNMSKRVDDTLEKLGLTNRRKQLAGHLSGGWKQRLALAAAVMHEPRLLLLDEPTAGVDPQARRDFWDEIHRLADDGMTVLVSTHYMDEAERCHEIAYIFNGNLIARGTPAEVVRQSGLVTFEAEGPRADKLSRELAGKHGVCSVAPFGQTLHVSGTDRAELEALIAPYRREPWRWTEVEPTLEDVFIRLLHGQQEHRSEAA